MKKILVSFAIFVAITLFANSLFAAPEASPVKLLRSVSMQAVAQLKADKIKASKKQLGSAQEKPTVHRIINKILLPHVDLNHMSRAVLGRVTWGKASAQQKKAFKKQFTDLVVNTYASALTTLDQKRIKFHPIRGGYKGKTIVQVNSEVDAAGAPPLPVVYYLQKKKNRWLVYDLSVDGISLVQSYKAQFVSLVQQQGLSGLIKTLRARNQNLASK